MTQSRITQPHISRPSRSAVLHISPDIDMGDPGRETVDMAILTHRSGWGSVIASSGGSLVMESERSAVRHIKLPIDRPGIFNNWRTRMQIESILLAERPDLIHAHGVEPLPFAIDFSRSRGIPLVADITQPFEQTSRHMKMMTQLQSVRSLIRVPTVYMRDYLHDTFGVSEEQISLVPPGVDLQWYSAGFISPERLRKINHLWRLPENASVIFMPMPLEPDMGHDILMQALSEMRKENVYAVMADRDGRSPILRAELESKISSYQLSGKVIMPEGCHDLPAACWLSSVVVAPNLAPRGQNLELLAAQSIGRPIICSDVGGNREMVLRGQTAWVIKPGDVGSLVKALREAVGLNTNQRLNLAATTHDFVAERFPQYMWFEQMMELYDTLIYPARNALSTNASNIANVA